MINATANGTFPCDARSAADLYLQRGLALVPLPLRSKDPGFDGWPVFRLDPHQLDQHFPPGVELNIAVLNGSPSAGHHDVDLDCVETIRAAPVLLPATGMVFGRKSARRSHRIYRTDRCLDQAAEPYRDLDGEMLVELRGTGGLTVFPPSLHRETGEAIRWETYGEPGTVSLDDLRRAVREVAAAALLARFWPAPGSRDAAALALTGGLLRGGWSEERVGRFVFAVAAAAGDEEVRSRAAKAPATARKQANGRKTTGWPALVQLLGERGADVVARIREWLEGVAATPAAWPDPLPLAEAPPVPVFPVEVLPPPLRRLMEETARATNTPTDFAAVPLLALAGGALANARHLRITRGHEQPPSLYAVIVSPPGTAKSPVLKLLRRPLDRAQSRYMEEWQREMDRWEGSDPEDRGPKPVLRRCLVSDITAESLGIILTENPRGVMMVRDELAALVAGMNQYKGGKGNDRQTYLSLWSGDPTLIDRKSDKSRHGAPLYVTDPFLGIVGTVQPEVVARLRGEPVRGMPPPDDGFIDRFLIVYPPRLPAVGETWRQVSPEAVAGWEAAVDRLLGLEMVREEGERPRPYYVPLTECGRTAWERFTHTHADETNADDFPPHLVGAWSKLRGYAGRLALIMHYLRWVCDEVTVEAVDGESLRRAAVLVDYFKGHARKVHAVMEADTRTPAAQRVVRWIIKAGRARFSVRDAFEGLKGTYRTVEELEAVLVLVERRGIIRPVQAAERVGRGRSPSPVYEVHPSILDTALRESAAAGDYPGGSGLPLNSANSANCANPFRGRAAEPDDPPEGGDGSGPASHYSQNSQKGLPPYRLVTDPADLATVLAALDDTAVAALDLETTGLDPRTDRIRLLSLGTDTVDGTTYAYLLDVQALDPAAIAPVLERLADKDLVAHNALFDLSFMSRRGFTPRGKVHDTLLLAQLLVAGTFDRVGLADCCKRWLGRKLDKTEQKGDWSGPLTEAQLSYAAEDVLVLPPLLAKLLAEIEAAKLVEAAELERRCLLAMVWMIDAGVPLDRAAWSMLADAARAEADRLRQELDAAAPPKPGEMFDAWNWSSTAQVKQVLALAGCPVEKTSDDALAALDHPLAALLRRHRQAEKRVAVYGAGWLDHVQKDGRVYPHWRQIGSRAGRMSCADPNMQQLPRGREYRRCVAAPDGRVLVKADYSQIELRIAAKVSGDKALLAAYQRGDDLHTLTAKAVLKVEQVGKADRQLAKALNFGLLYGMGANGFAAYAKAQYHLDLTAAQAKAYRAAFFHAYPGLAAWHRQTGASGKTAVERRTLTGRRRLNVERFTEKLNTPVQGTGADGLKRALALLWETRDRVPGAAVVLAVHDEIVVEVDANQADAAAAWLKTCMVEAMAPLIDPVPVEVEVTVGQTWGGG